MEEFIRVPYGSTVHGDEEIAAVVNVLNTTTQMSKNVLLFEEKIAASFNKKVINVGNRQKGRDYGENVYHVKFDSKKIIELTEKTLQLPDSKFKNIYEKRNTSIKIIKIIKKIF